MKGTSKLRISNLEEELFDDDEDDDDYFNNTSIYQCNINIPANQPSAFA